MLPRTKADRDAFFAKMFAGVKPAELKPQSMTAVLKPYRRQLAAKRREGYSLRQITEQLKSSPLQCDISPSMLKVILAGPSAMRRAKMKKLVAQRTATGAVSKNPLTPTPNA